MNRTAPTPPSATAPTPPSATRQIPLELDAETLGLIEAWGAAWLALNPGAPRLSRVATVRMMIRAARPPRRSR